MLAAVQNSGLRRVGDVTGSLLERSVKPLPLAGDRFAGGPGGDQSLLRWAATRKGGSWGVWNQFWFAEVSGHSLAAFRISFGIYLLGYFGSFAPNVNLIFSSDGITIPYLIPDWSLPPVLCTALY